MKFDYKSYINLLMKLVSLEYKICGYTDYKEYKQVAILRHDVDMSLEKAVDMSEIERKIGVKSTYFLLLTSDFYNLASLKNLKLVEKIKNAGHEIGLHFDEVRYTNLKDTKQVEEKIKKEIELTEKILDIKISAVSMHRPSKWILDSEISLGKDVINSYSTEFFKEFKYVSDSRRNWREDILELVNKKEYKKIHILTHPIWYSETELAMKDALHRFIEEGKLERYKGLCNNILDFESIMGECDT